MALTINQIIKKMTPKAFNDNIKAVGLNRYEIISEKSIILYGPSKSKNDRKQALNDLALIFNNYGAQYVEKSAASSAGIVAIGDLKIQLKPEKTPGTGGGFILKPGFFGDAKTKIVDVDIPFKSYASRLMNSIQSTSKLSDLQKELLFALVEDSSSTSANSKAKVKKMMSAVGEGITLNTINNDFGEVLGPLAIVSRGLLPIDVKTAVVNIPGRSNEPLLDYKIKDSKREYKISAKSGTTTNTLKPGDVVNLIKDDNFLKKKWSKSLQYKVLEILNDGSTKQGPIDAAMYLKNNGYEKNFPWLKTATYTEQIRQKCEDTIVQISKELIDFTEIFSDSTTSKIFYVKFKIVPLGTIEWHLVETVQDKKEEKKASKRVVFRSKNFVGRAKDKLGFQV